MKYFSPKGLWQTNQWLMPAYVGVDEKGTIQHLSSEAPKEAIAVEAIDGFALPGFVVGILLLTLFSFQLEWFPFGGFVSDEFEELDTLSAQIYEILWHAVLPLMAYAIGDFAILTMTMKNSLMENLSADYVRTAIAKGLPFDKALKQHALRNSLIPIASHFGAVVSVFFAGSFLIEAVFNIDGIGLLGYDAILQRDYPVVMGILVMTSIAMMIGNILSDICVALVDPRVKFGK